ncbi:hypothetical protein QR680_001517 [Steinernema hermaphroditum]|uniref:DSBA-like thioredoxin domain-containing protein n=1 Tax=Steinernema hermaphroditum TaxID=289476 RepID=A0AA39H091_9BILA|nr:hypothetical protein QR680_001517 [Steinernema hermaphroditum]
MSIRLSSGIKFYFDAMCPNSFTGFQLLQKSNLEYIEFKPIIRRKLFSKTGRMESLLIPSSYYRNLEDFRRDHGLLPTSLQCVDHRSYGVGKATLFLTSINRHHPHLAHNAVQEVFARFWIDGANIDRAPSFMTVCRKIGLTFAESDELVSKLEERLNVDAMNAYLHDALEAQHLDTPCTELYNDVNEKVQTITELKILADELRSI